MEAGPQRKTCVPAVSGPAAAWISPAVRRPWLRLKTGWSTGRLGLFVEITAPIGDIGFHGQWTLMLSAIRPLRVYAGMKLGQIMFFVSTGAIDLYAGKYQSSAGPQPSRYWHDIPRPDQGQAS
jgi:hypothetical protein